MVFLNTLTLPETNSKHPKKWMVGILSRFLLGRKQAYFQGVKVLVSGNEISD